MCEEQPALLRVDVHLAAVDVGLNGQETSAEDDELSLRQTAEVGKARGHTAARLVEDGIDGAYQGVVAVVDVILVGSPAVADGGAVDS